MPLKVGVFGANDASIIAEIHFSTRLSFMNYQFGKARDDEILEYLTKKYENDLKQIEKEGDNSTLVHAKVVYWNGYKETPIAWAEWERMLYDPLKHPSLPEVSPKFNQKFIEAVDAGARRIYKKHLTGQDIIVLGQLFTLPEYQRHGAATKLMESTLRDVDKLGVKCFLEVDGDSWQRMWYETRWHFQEVDKCEINLEDCKLGEGTYRHVAMIRDVRGRTKIDDL